MGVAVNVLTGSDQWVGLADVVTGWWIHCLLHNGVSNSSWVCFFFAISSLLSVQFLYIVFHSVINRRETLTQYACVVMFTTLE